MYTLDKVVAYTYMLVGCIVIAASLLGLNEQEFKGIYLLLGGIFLGIGSLYERTSRTSKTQ